MTARMEKAASGIDLCWHQLRWREMGLVFAGSTGAGPGKVLVVSELKCRRLGSLPFCQKVDVICLAWPKQMCLVGNAKGTELTHRAALQKPGVSLVPGVWLAVPGGLFVRGAVGARVLCGEGSWG